MIQEDNSFSYKRFFIKYGFFLAIIVILFFILLYSVILSRKPWQKYLQVQVEKVLDDYDPDNWIIGNFKKIDNPFCLNGACYEARYKKTGDQYDVLILRIQTFYGPVSAVFLVDKNDIVNFIGYSSLHGRVQTQLLNSQSDKRLDYWKKQVPKIIGRKDVKNEK